MDFDWQDFNEGVGGLAQDWFTGGIDELGAVKDAPGLSSFVSGVTSAYHLGSAVYDGVTGDRDGAVAHGASALVNGLGAIPAVGEAIGGIDTALGLTGTAARYANTIGGTPGEGIEPGDIPTGLDDIAASAAVGATNLIFGADDSNLIASGDTPQGTRQGEIASGLSMAAPLALSVLGPYGMIGGSLFGDTLGEAGASVFAPIGENTPGESTNPGSTSGAAPGIIASEAAKVHDGIMASGNVPAGPGMFTDLGDWF